VSSGAIVFIAPGTRAQATVACVLAVFSMAIALQCRPHEDTADGQVYTIGAVVIFLSMFLSLAVKTDSSGETEASEHAFAVVLIVLNIVMAGAALVQMAFVVRKAYRKQIKTMKTSGARTEDDNVADANSSFGGAVDRAMRA
jgi:hypothetical protein